MFPFSQSGLALAMASVSWLSSPPALLMRLLGPSEEWVLFILQSQGLPNLHSHVSPLLRAQLNVVSSDAVFSFTSPFPLIYPQGVILSPVVSKSPSPPQH